MKSRLAIVFSIIIIILCVFSPFIISNLQNQRMLQKTYYLDKESTNEKEKLNLFEKIMIYEMGTSTWVNDSADESESSEEDIAYGFESEDSAKGEFVVAQKVQRELGKLQDIGVFPKYLDVQKICVSITWQELRMFMGDEESYEPVMVWNVEFYSQEYDLGGFVALEAQSGKIIESYYEYKYLQPPVISDDAVMAEELRNYFGAWNVSVVDDGSFRLQMDYEQIVYHVDEYGMLVVEYGMQEAKDTTMMQ